jgi:hypothetical protein
VFLSLYEFESGIANVIETRRNPQLFDSVGDYSLRRGNPDQDAWRVGLFSCSVVCSH